MDLSDGFPIDEPPVVVPWNVSEDELGLLLGPVLRHVTDKYWTARVQVLGGLACNLGFHFRGGRADQIVGTLSGGERFRATLAALMLAEPAPQLLLLDEPTNSLDIASSEQLSQALARYEGALIVASHDVRFLRTLGITRWVQLDAALAEVDPPG